MLEDLSAQTPAYILLLRSLLLHCSLTHYDCVQDGRREIEVCVLRGQLCGADSLLPL